VNALRVTHDGPIKGKLTVVGHSYGSTVTGLALQREHLIVDQVALIGSPGVGGGAQTAAGLGLDKNTLFVGADSRDIVTTGTREFFHTLGADPTLDQFGESVTRFKAENVNRGDHINFNDHSLYYDETTQSESLHSLSRIVTGYGDTLREEGMLAEPRHTVPPVPGNPYSHTRVDDKEGNRAPTPGHANTQVNP
jgi:pimeloyl-ACP methyl ester carboxylesterase